MMARPREFLERGAAHVPGTDKKWIDRAACREDWDPELWTFVHKNAGHSSCEHALARHICLEHCPVQAECLKDAMEFPEQWGGMVIGGYYWGGRAKRRKVPFHRQPEFRRTCSECHKLVAA